MDLTKKACRATVLRLLNDPELVFVHSGPPCGTFTRAREIPIPQWKLDQGCPAPMPLRSQTHPEGLPDNQLSDVDKIKVRKGNIIAKFCAKIARICNEKGIHWSMENPTNSYLWQMPDQQKLLQLPNVRSVDFQACMWGGDRPKKTSFLTNCPKLEILRSTCDNKHQHKPWGVFKEKGSGWHFSTAEECEYPQKLCRAITSAITEATEEKIKGCLEKPPQRIKTKSRTSQATMLHSAAVGNQKKRLIWPYSITELKPPIWIPLREHMSTTNIATCLGKYKESTFIGKTFIPKGASILEHFQQPERDSSGSEIPRTWIKIAKPWSEDEFFKLAIQAKHPISTEPPVADATKAVIFEILTSGKKAWRTKVRKELDTIKEKVKQLHAKEAEFREMAHEAIQPIILKKNTLCMGQLLNSIGYPDKLLTHRMRTGFGITGETDTTNIFCKKPEEELIQGADPMTWLPRLALESRKLLKKSLHQQEVDDILKDLHRTTMHEVAKGWASGPFTEKQMTKLIGHGKWTASRRFGVSQGEKTLPDGTTAPKIRQIDDLSEYMVNACATITEKVEVDGIDRIANLIKLWADLISKAKEDPHRKLTVTLLCGKVLTGTLHKDFTGKKSQP